MKGPKLWATKRTEWKHVQNWICSDKTSIFYKTALFSVWPFTFFWSINSVTSIFSPHNLIIHNISNAFSLNVCILNCTFAFGHVKQVTCKANENSLNANYKSLLRNSINQLNYLNFCATKSYYYSQYFR